MLTPLALRELERRRILLIYNSIDPEVSRVVWNNSLRSRNLELNPLGEYNSLSAFQASLAVPLSYICNKGPSSIPNRIIARALAIILASRLSSSRAKL